MSIYLTRLDFPNHFNRFPSLFRFCSQHLFFKRTLHQLVRSIVCFPEDKFLSNNALKSIRLNKSVQSTNFTIIDKNCLMSTMSADTEHCTNKALDGAEADSPKTMDTDTVSVAASSVIPVIGGVRNVQTQHGDYRSVDEENIVVLQRCLSPPPAGTRSHGEDDGSGENSTEEEPEQVVWIEPFLEVKL